MFDIIEKYYIVTCPDIGSVIYADVSSKLHNIDIALALYFLIIIYRFIFL